MQQSRIAARRLDYVNELRRRFNVEYRLPPPRAEILVTDSPAKGFATAPVLITVFSDFECPFCARHAAAMRELVGHFDKQVRLEFRHFPLPFHKSAPKASEAAACANEQGRFWEMHDRLFERQKNLGVDDLKRHATELALNPGVVLGLSGFRKVRGASQARQTGRRAPGGRCHSSHVHQRTPGPLAPWRSASSFRWSRRSWRESARDNRQLLQAVKRLDDNVRIHVHDIYSTATLHFGRRSPTRVGLRRRPAGAGQRPPTQLRCRPAAPAPSFSSLLSHCPFRVRPPRQCRSFAPKSPFTSKTTPLREPSAALRPTARLI